MRTSRFPVLRAALTHGALVTLVAVFSLPLWGMVATALKSEAQVQDVSSLSRILVPDPVKWDNFAQVFRRSAFPRYFANSLLLVLLNVAGVAVVCPLVAYGFSRFDWPGREAVFFLLLSTMMLPPQVTMAPVYLIFSSLGWVNTFKPLWVPAWFGVPFYIFLLRQFLRGVPRELDEAAMLDGASSWTAFWLVILPQIRPAVAAVVLFQTVAVWNDFMGPLIYLNSERLKTIQLGLRMFIAQYSAEYSLIMAASIVSLVPVFIVFLFMQRFFIEGVATSGIKG